MSNKTRLTLFIAGSLILVFGLGLWLHHREEEGFPAWPIRRASTEITRPGKWDFQPATDGTYIQSCSTCHFPYPPGLLPGPSWKRILERLDDHFGEQISLDPKSKEEILNYLTANGADRSRDRKSQKIMKSLNGRIPNRITEIPLFQKKHRGIQAEVISRKSVGSLSNCIACHRTADQGVFHEGYVKIPE